MAFPPAAAQALDAALLLKINRAWAHPALDAVLPVLTDLHKSRWVLYGAAPALLAAWLWRGGRSAARILLAAALAVAAADLVNHRILKPLAARPRPPAAGVPVLLRTKTHYGLSFPSNHAANTAAAAAVLSAGYPAWMPLWAGAAFAVAYSRVYCGVHYPLDVAAGALVGAAAGRLVAWLLLAGAAGGRKSRKKRG